MYKIGTNGKLQIENQKAILVLRKSYGSIRSSVFISLFGLVFLIPVLNGSFLPGSSSFVAAFGIFFVLWLFPVYLAGYSERIELNLSTRTIARTQLFFWIYHKKSSMSWPEPYVLKYSMAYGPYHIPAGNEDLHFYISKIWLTAYSEETSKENKLIGFSEKKTVLDFQKFFNQHFPENKMQEWHG